MDDIRLLVQKMLGLDLNLQPFYALLDTDEVIGAHNNLQRLFHLDQKPDYEEIKKLTSRWHPYEGLVYFHLLLNKLNLKGVI